MKRKLQYKRSGKPTSQHWLYPGPFGKEGNVASTLFQESIHAPPNSGFSVTGAHRNVGRVGKHMMMSQSGTPFKGVHPRGWGGKNGRYPSGPNNQVLNVPPLLFVQSNIVKPPVLSTKGMLHRRFRWIHSGQYPNYWVQPIYTGNQTDSASQGVYIHNKTIAQMKYDEVNNAHDYLTYYQQCTNSSGIGCNGNEYYTKTIRQPLDSSVRTARIQYNCQNQTERQKPFPYAVQTGTGILTGGTSVSNVGSACGTTANVLLRSPFS
jgi:hypothetical protein